MNWKLWRRASEILFRNRRRNVSHSFYSRMVTANHSLRGSHFPRSRKKNFGPQHYDDTTIILLPVDFTPWSSRGYSGGKASSAIIYHEQDTELGPQTTKRGEAWFLASGAYRLAGEVRHKPQSEIHSH